MLVIKDEAAELQGLRSCVGVIHECVSAQPLPSFHWCPESGV